MKMKMGSKSQRTRQQKQSIIIFPLLLKDAMHGVSALTVEALILSNPTALTLLIKLAPHNQVRVYKFKRRKRLQVVAAPAATVTG